ncbi:MAG: tetratricopeptide repeat protein, partial [Actinobacteria bacterium]|nr:tetratricopeptide repeat protein [Actinomycetota bacterium]
LDKLGQHNEALDCFNEAIKINPEFEDAWCNKGITFDKLGKYDEEMDCFNEAIKINPFYYRSWYYKGAALIELGQVKEAKRCYDIALKIQKKSSKFNRMRLPFIKAQFLNKI